jgi:hypothetical protein
VLAVWAAEQLRSAEDVRGWAGGIVPFKFATCGCLGCCRLGWRPWSLKAQWRGIAGTSTKCSAVPGAWTFRGQGPAGMSGRQLPKRLGSYSGGGGGVPQPSPFAAMASQMQLAIVAGAAA